MSDFFTPLVHWSRQYPALRWGWFLAAGWTLYWGLRILAGLEALSATNWMNIVVAHDFTNWGELWGYLKELKTGIPPFLFVLEVLMEWSSDAATGLKVWVRHGYRDMLVGMLLMVGLLVRRDRSTWLAFFPALLILVPGMERVLYGSAKIMYDAVFPCLLLFFLGGVGEARRLGQGRSAVTWAFLAGFALSAAELSRTFILVLLPFLVAWALLQLGQRRLYRLMLAFLLPILLLSGGWHLRLMVVHDQLFWSNHGGCNLHNAWLPLVDHEVLEPQLEPEAPPRDQWKLNDLNTDIHDRNCERMKAHVVSQIQAHPDQAWQVFQDNAVRVFRAPVGMYNYWPEGLRIELYRWLVRLMYLAEGLLLMVYLSRSWRDPRHLYSLDGAMLFISLSLSFFSIIGERWEVSRFLVSTLPFLLYLWVRAFQWIADELRLRFFKQKAQLYS